MDTTKRQQGNGSELLEVKKSAHVNLEQHKTTWLLIGYILVFGVLFVAFEWTATEKKHTGEIVSAGILLEEEIMVPITMPEKKVVPPPPQAKQITEILEIVDDEAEIEESELASVEETGEVVEIADVGNVVVEDIPEEELSEALETPDVVLEEINYVEDNDEELEEGVEVIGVVWPEKANRNKVYRYDPDGEKLEKGDLVLVPTRDVHKNKEVIRKAAVAHENHRIDPALHPHAIKKIIGVIRRHADAVLAPAHTDAEQNNNEE